MTGEGVTLSIPKAWAVVASAEFPSTVRENLASVVAYELDRVTPFSSDDAFFDFTVLKEMDERISLQVTAARAGAVRAAAHPRGKAFPRERHDNARRARARSL